MEPGNYLSESTMAAALASDAILSGLLIFLWLTQRKEKHALFWGAGQLAMMAGVMAWFIGEDVLPHQIRLFVCALMLTFGLVGYWGGTQYFLGHLNRRHLRAISTAVIVLTGLFYLLWNLFYEIVVPATASVMGVVMLWMGVRLVRAQKRYRWLGYTLVARGIFNIISSITLEPELYLLWFAGTSILKTLSMLGLIYSVQDEIQQRYVRTIDSLSHGFLIRDRGGYVHVANERCARLLGFDSASDLIGKHVCQLLPDLSREMADEYFQRFDAKGVQYPMTETATFRLHNGTRLPVEMMGSPYIERGRLYCLVQLLDISERKKKDDMLYQAARVDPVTGFFNRHALSTSLAQEVARAAAAGRECAVLFLDLDKFKRINDSFGHAIGDELLRQTAHRLYGVLRPNDVLARFGGDEFIIVIPDLAPGTAALMATQCAERVIGAMASRFDLSHHAIAVSASVGVACYPLHGSDSDMLIRNADIAMYEAKKAGRGELRFFNDAMNAAAKDALVIDGALRGAIEAGEFNLLYQAIVDARTGKLGKVEALLRWHSAGLGWIAPDRFIPVAEDSGMIVAIGSWVLDEACRQMARWRGGPLDGVTISINVSAWQLADPAFVTLVEQALASNGLDGRQLELELTERVLIDDGGQVRAVLRRLRALGVSISLDDFGTGYSSLSYLTRFQLNTLKIDRAFVMDIEHSERITSLVNAIIAMGHSLGLQLVAEGVETAGQAAILEKMGCHYLQGYHFSRPIPPDELLRFAGERRLPAS
ncbi:EAL domain-containing protein [Oxalobacteraceae bacterium OTU3CAMAD1]|nr:EAL domain-containing protein [Oxalobacteraceae bacterium OTU3CAMAD1]